MKYILCKLKQKNKDQDDGNIHNCPQYIYYNYQYNISRTFTYLPNCHYKPYTVFNIFFYYVACFAECRRIILLLIFTYYSSTTVIDTISL